MKSRRASFIAAAFAAYLAAVLFFRPHPTPGPAMRDFEAYYAAGVTWNHGGNPYDRDIWNAERDIPGVNASHDETLPFVNPPPLLPAFGLFAGLPFQNAVVLWGVLLGVSALLLLGTTLWMIGRVRDPISWLAAIPLGLAFGPLSSSLALGQIALLSAAAATFACALFATKRHTGGSLAALVAATQPSLGVPLASVWRDRRALAFLVGAALVYLFTWAVVQNGGTVPSIFGYAGLLRAHGSAERFALIQYTPTAIAYGIGVAESIAVVLGVVVALAAIAHWFYWGRKLQIVQSFGLLALVLPLIVPFFHEHDFVIVLPAALLVAGMLPRGHARGFAMAATVCVAIDWLGLAQRPDGWIQALLLAIAVIAAQLALFDAPLHAAAPSLPIGIMLLAAAMIAQHHAAPVWPDAMRAFTLAPRTEIATLWHAEQNASGMFAPDAFFAILRALPLLACGGLVLLHRRATS